MTLLTDKQLFGQQTKRLLSDEELGVPTSGVTIAPKGGAPREATPAEARMDSAAQLADLAKSFLAGVERAGIGLAGLPADIGAVMQFLAGVQDEAKRAKELGIGTMFPTSAELTKSVESVTGPIHEPQTTAGKFARSVGEFAPAALFPGGIAARAANVAIPAVASEAAGQATEGTTVEPFARVAGAVAGGVAPSALRRAVTPFPASPERAAAVKTLRQEGVRPTAGQATGSRNLQAAESELGGSAALRAADRQNEQFTRAVLKRAGIKAERATPEVIDDAFTRIGGDFDRLAANNRIVPQAHSELQRDLRAVATEYADVVPPAQQARVVANTIDDITSRIGSGQAIPGTVYQSFRSRFDRLARGARNDPQLSEALFSIRNALDSAMARSLQLTGRTRDAAAWQNARREYRNLLVIERAATGGGSDAALGIISPARLRQADVGQNRRRFVRGQSDFSDLARSGQAVMSPFPESGTARRAATRLLPTIIGAGLGGASGGGIGAAIGAGLGNFATGRALMSRPVQSFLGNQVFPQTNQSLLPMSLANALLARP